MPRRACCAQAHVHTCMPRRACCAHAHVHTYRLVAQACASLRVEGMAGSCTWAGQAHGAAWQANGVT
eukprot:354182-Chlamydomonas_euryale.AAC.7